MYAHMGVSTRPEYSIGNVIYTLLCLLVLAVVLGCSSSDGVSAVVPFSAESSVCSVCLTVSAVGVFLRSCCLSGEL